MDTRSPSKILVTVVILAFLAVVAQAQLPGFKATINQDTLNYFATVGVQVLESQLSDIAVPDISGTDSVPVIGNIDYDLSNIHIVSLALPQYQLVIDSMNAGFSGAVNGASAQVTLDWHYEVEMWPHPSDSGTATITISQTTLGVVVEVAESNGRPTVDTGSPTVDIGDFSISLSGGASWLYNLFIGLFQGSIQSSVQSSLSQAIQQAINDNANQALSTLPVQEDINNQLAIDYSLVADVTYATNYFTTSHRGEFIDPSNPVASPGNAVAMPDYVDLTRMLEVLLSEYSANSALFVLQQTNQLTFTITEDMLQPKVPLHLNTSDFGWIVLAPNLTTDFPNMAMQLVIDATAAPTAQILSSGALVNATGIITVQVIQPNGTLFNAFVINGTVHCAANATMVAQNLSVELIYLHTDFGLESSNIGTVHISLFNTLIDQLATSIIPLINTRIQPGFPIPSIDGLTFTNPEVDWEDGFVMVATDVTYNPSVLQQRIKYSKQRV